MAVRSRKGPWTEQEDLHLVWFVRLFGERRWDYLAKVSGLNRSGKSCRLRWVNYLHPDLKHGRMTPEEELLILQLHAEWGNRWSRIARCLPGRTDNEIKNYWRTHMRKRAQERSMSMIGESASMSSSSPLSSPSSSSSHGCSSATCDPKQEMESAGLEGVKAYSMDQIWEEIAAGSSAAGERGDGAWCAPTGEEEQLRMMTDEPDLGNMHGV